MPLKIKGDFVARRRPSPSSSLSHPVAPLPSSSSSPVTPSPLSTTSSPVARSRRRHHRCCRCPLRIHPRCRIPPRRCHRHPRRRPSHRSHGVVARHAVTIVVDIVVRRAVAIEPQTHQRAYPACIESSFGTGPSE